MNYLTLINQFWTLRREVPFSSTEADLYFYLLNVSNGLQWKNPFQQANPLIGATLGISEKTLIAARNRLKQYGLIDFTPGVKRSPSTYRLLVLEKFQPILQSISIAANTLENLQGIREECDSESGSESDSVFGSVSGTNAPAITKQKQEVNQTKGNSAPDSAADAAAGGPEKKIEVNVSPAAPPLAAQREASHTKGGAAKTGKAPAAPLPEECPLADLLNPGGEAERVQQVSKPLTYEQADKLLTDYAEPAVRDILCQMANWKPLLTKCESVNLTARNWLGKRATDAQPSTSTSHVSGSRTYPTRSANGAKPDAATAGSLARSLSGQYRERVGP